MITGIVGLPGSGKTLYALQLMLDARKKGRAVMANFHSRSGMWDYGLWTKMKECTNALVVIDEAQMWFGSRAWQGTKQSELSIFQQSRKQGVDLIWIAQHEARVDTAINEVTAFYERCTMTCGGRLCIVRRMTPDDRKKVLKRTLYKPHSGLFRHYWSEEVIGDRTGDGAGFGNSSVLAGGPERSDGPTAQRMWLGADGELHCVPSQWVVAFPLGQSKVVSKLADLPRVIGESCEAYRVAWGVLKNPYDVLTGVYIDTLGRRHVVDAEGLLIGDSDSSAPVTWLRSALDDLDARLQGVNGRAALVSLGSVRSAGLAVAVAAGYRPSHHG